MAKLVLVTVDLIVASRVESAARKCGLDIATGSAQAASVAAADENCRMVLIDLRCPGLDLPKLVGALKLLTPPPRIVAFGPHVHEQSLEAARAAGCDLVVTRGQLDREAESLLHPYCEAE